MLRVFSAVLLSLLFAPGASAQEPDPSLQLVLKMIKAFTA